MTTQRATLAALDRVRPYLLPLMALWTDTNALLGRPVSLTALQDTLVELEAKRFVVSIDQDGVAKWRISDLGSAELRAGG